MRLSEILKGIEFKADRDIAKTEISRITCDSRAAARGALFIALRGHKCDGHDFIQDSLTKGAVAIVSERDFNDPAGAAAKVLIKGTKGILPKLAANFYADPAKKLKIIGITGTNGKTTITYLVERILKAGRRGAGVIGTINYRLGGRTLESKNTTPGPLELAEIFREMVDAGLDYAVMEASSHALDQGRLRGLEFGTACFTNITKEHLDYHKTIGRYLKAKSRIFGYLKKGGFAVLNADDARVFGLKGSIKNPVITYGIRANASVKARDIKTSLDGSEFTIKTRAWKFRVRTPLMGLHNVSNILAATAIAIAEGVELKHIKAGIEGLELVPGRLETVSAGRAFKIFVDYAHTENALYNVLTLLKGAAGGDVITVFGCGGDRDRLKRPLMGKTACELSDKVVITSDNPRSERSIDIIADIVKGVKGRHSNFLVEEDRATAIKEALRMARPDDIVLIAGKGHETYQIVGDKTIPFDDREVVRDYLR